MARLLYLVSEDWYFLSHRLPMARAARDAGHEVHVATRVANGAAAIRAEGFELHPLNWRRGSTNPLAFLQAVMAARSVYRALAPDLVHQIALWPAIVGSLAGVGLPGVRLSALAGLGFAFTSDSPKARAVRVVLAAAAAPSPGRPADRRPGAESGRPSGDGRASVSTRPEYFLFPAPASTATRCSRCPKPADWSRSPTSAVCSLTRACANWRRAHALLTARGVNVRLLIAGSADPANPGSIPPEEIESWRARPGIELLGHIADIRQVWAEAHIAVLPSRREGLPKSLLEAAACGRPIVATDVPGCREIAHAGVNALLVPPDDAVALADAVARLAADPELRARFGRAGRQLVEDKFSSERIGREVATLYDRLLQRTPERQPTIKRPSVAR